MTAEDETVAAVADVVAAVLGIADRRDELTRETGLFGAMPEMDSLAVVELMTALEDRFGIEIAAEDLTAEHFGDLGSLSSLVQSLR